MDKPPLGYHLRKRLYGPERWFRYLDSLDWSSPPPPPEPLAARFPPPKKDVDIRTYEQYQEFKKEWQSKQVCLKCNRPGIHTHKMDERHAMKLLEAQPFRDP